MHTIIRFVALLGFGVHALNIDTYSFDGGGNNQIHPEWGARNTPRIRSKPTVVGFLDGRDTPADEIIAGLPSARRIMENVFHAIKPQKDKDGNHLMLEFGHFMVHDLMADSSDNTGEAFDIPCDGDLNDLMFCPATGRFYNVTEIPFNRRRHVQSSLSTPRSTLQGQTHFLDLSNVYGYDEERVKLMKGESGKFDLEGFGERDEVDLNGLVPVENIYSGGMNTSPGAYAFYVLFMRYHNMVAEEYATKNPSLKNDEIYLLARRKTIAVYQSIVEEKYIPSLVGRKLPDYTGYNESVNPSVDEFFASVGFRYAHSSFSGVIRLVDKDFIPTSSDPMYLRDVFKQEFPNDVPSVVARMGGIEPFLRGLTMVRSKAVDASFVDDLNFWSEATSVLDVQRARDVGIPPYNVARKAFGLAPMSSISELVNNDTSLTRIISELYNDDIDKVDAYVGALLEPYETSIDNLGSLMSRSVLDQFTRTRDGDRFWFKNTFNKTEYEEFPTLTEIIQSVCEDMDNFPEDSFRWNAGPDGSSSEDEGVCDASSSQLSILGGALFLGWEVVDPAANQRGVKSGKNRNIEVTIRFNEVMEGNGFLGVGWGSQRMLGAEIWFCTVNDQAMKSLGPFPDECVLQTEKTEREELFSCCVAPGTMHDAPVCSGVDAPIYYDLEVTDWCLSLESSSVTVRAPVCDDDAVDGTFGDPRECFRLSSTSDGKMDFIVAYNPLAQNRPHGYQRRTSAQIDLKGGVLTSAESQISDEGLIATHAVFMLLSWMVLAPAGIFVVRYMKSRSWRMVFHVGIMGIVGSLMVPLLIGIEASVGATSARTEHKVVGLSLMMVYFFMAAAGRIRFLKLSGKKIGRRTDLFTQFFHRYVGTAIVVLSWWNCYTGLVKIGPEDAYTQIIVLSSFSLGYNIPVFGQIRKYVFFPYLGFVVLVFLIAEIRQRRAQKANKDKVKAVVEGVEGIWDDDGENLETMTMESFLDVSRHLALCIVDGRVLDITDFKEIHPGGTDMLRYAQGSDITAEFLGQRDVDGIRHIHGSGALKVMKTLVKAKLVFKSGEDGSLGSLEQTVPEGQGSIEFRVKSQAPEKRLLGDVFVPGRVVSVKYLTPEIEITDSCRPSILLSLAVPHTANQKGRDLLPSSAFTFRGIDERGRQIERQYTPVVLHEKFSKKIRGSSRLSIMNLATTMTKANIDIKEETYDFIISLVPGGQMSKHFLNLKPNKTILCKGPLVNNKTIEKLMEGWKDVVMFAAGTGISPMLQLMDFFTNGGSGSLEVACPQMYVVWIVKDQEHNYTDILALQSRARRSHGRLKYTIIYSSSTSDTPSCSDSGNEIDNSINPKVDTANSTKSMEASQILSGLWRSVTTGRDSKKEISSRKEPSQSQWSLKQLMDDSIAYRAKQGLKSIFAKQSMRVQDIIEAAHRNKHNHSSMYVLNRRTALQKPLEKVEFNADFWKHNGRICSIRVNEKVVQDILQSVQDAANARKEKTMDSDPKSRSYGSRWKAASTSSNKRALSMDQSGHRLSLSLESSSLELISEGDETVGSIEARDSYAVDDNAKGEEEDNAVGTGNSEALRPTMEAEVSMALLDLEEGGRQEGGSYSEILIAISGSPRFEMSLLQGLVALGFPRDQIANFTRSHHKETKGASSSNLDHGSFSV